MPACMTTILSLTQSLPLVHNSQQIFTQLATILCIFTHDMLLHNHGICYGIVSFTSWNCTPTVELTEFIFVIKATLGLSYIVLEGNSGICNVTFSQTLDFKKFRHGTSIISVVNNASLSYSASTIVYNMMSMTQ